MTSVRERGLPLLRRHFEDQGWRVRESTRGHLPVLVVDRGGVKRTVRWSTKSSGSWQTSITNEPFVGDLHSDRFWAFVDASAEPRIYVVPEHAARTAIRQGHEEYLARHGGHPAKTDKTAKKARKTKSTHFAMHPDVVEQLVRDYPSRWH
ncbi:hypothetical protein ACH9EU_17090 [Kocuria sp. M1R5S2]|uniref:hypothetical protein n=1 Tax=Kocuria rhizosphaerae TaxID=3376285 RepID=UPI003790D41F